MGVIQFVLKVVIASAILSVAIKYGGPLLPLPTTGVTALTIVLLPPLLTAIALGWRFWQQQQH